MTALCEFCKVFVTHINGGKYPVTPNPQMIAMKVLSLHLHVPERL